MQTLKDSFRFKLGNFECQVIKDGTLMGNKQDAEHGYKTIDVLSLLIKTGEHTVLVDTGLGENAVVGGIIQTNVGKLPQILQNEGIKKSEIDFVILSHAHPDHIGGVTDSKGISVFPNARHIMSKKEWDFWMSEPELTNIDEHFKQATISAINKNLIALRDRFDLLEDGNEIVPGIKLIDSAGHTPGHISLLISSGDKNLLCIFDMMYTPLEFTQPELFKSSDNMLPEQANIARDRTFSRIATSGYLVFVSHFSFPGLGYILQKGNGYSWKEFK